MRNTTISMFLGAALAAGGLGAVQVGLAQPPTLERLEDSIRGGTSPAGAPSLLPGGKTKPYLGARADDSNEHGRGVRVLFVWPGGPAQRAGLQAQDLVVGARGVRVRQLADLTGVLDTAAPGDRIAIEVLRAGRSLKVEVLLGSQTFVGGAGPPEAIPPPVASPGGPSLAVPPPPGIEAPPAAPAMTDAARIAQLQRRVEQLERRVQELERAAAEGRKPRIVE